MIIADFKFLRFMLIVLLCICVGMYVFMDVCVDAQRGQKRISNPLQLELQALELLNIDVGDPIHSYARTVTWLIPVNLTQIGLMQ